MYYRCSKTCEIALEVERNEPRFVCWRVDVWVLTGSFPSTAPPWDRHCVCPPPATTAEQQIPASEIRPSWLKRVSKSAFRTEEYEQVEAGGPARRPESDSVCSDSQGALHFIVFQHCGVVSSFSTRVCRVGL